MWILRLILVLLGFLLLRRLLRPFGGGKQRQAPGAQSPDASRPPAVPFKEADIQDADYEEIESRRSAGEGGP